MFNSFALQFYLEGWYSTRNAFLSWIRFSLKWSFIIKSRCSREEIAKSFHNAASGTSKPFESYPRYCRWSLRNSWHSKSLIQKSHEKYASPSVHFFAYWRIELVKRTMRTRCGTRCVRIVHAIVQCVCVFPIVYIIPVIPRIKNSLWWWVMDGAPQRSLAHLFAFIRDHFQFFYASQIIQAII